MKGPLLTHFSLKLILVLLLVNQVNIAFSQVNPSSIEFQIKSGSSYSFEIQSSTSPDNIYPGSFHGTVKTAEKTGKTNTYDIIFNAPEQFEGTVQWHISYTSINPFPPYNTLTNQIQIIAHIRKSVIVTNDVIAVYTGGETLTISPLSNDDASDGPLTLTGVSNVHFGTTQLSNNNIVYTPKNTFTGRDIITYNVKDGLGEKSSGRIYVISENKGFSGTQKILLTVSSENPRYLFLPLSEMSLISHKGTNGTVEKRHDMAYLYRAQPGKKGKDNITFRSSKGGEILFEITVVDNSPENGQVRDDRAYTAIGKEVIFNVLENDFLKTPNIVYHSPQLKNLGNGYFSYTPPPGFSGFKNFTYKVNSGSGILTGKITVKVDNYYPLNQTYHFATPQGKELILEYDVPITGYDFAILGNPANGTLEVFSGMSEVGVNCGNIQSKSMVIYTPHAQFTGNDAFDLQYCIDGKQCRVIKSTIHVYSDPSTDCDCVEGCVWPGDTDHNGVVNMADLLPVGFYMGESGPPRQDVTYDEWNKQKAEDWHSYQEHGPNVKHVDADGDGIITHADTSIIWDHLWKSHGFIPSSSEVTKKSPLKLIPRNPDVKAGDILILDIYLGDSKFPVLDIHGLSFAINVDPAFIDSASVEVIFFDDSWMSEGFGQIKKFAQQSSGYISAGTTLTSRLPKSGHGLIGAILFGVEEDIQGFRLPKDIKKLPFSIQLSEILAMDSQGNTYTMPAEDALVHLHLTQGDNIVVAPTPVLRNEIVVFPNPASDIIQIEMPVDRPIREASLFDLMGRRIIFAPNLEHHQLSMPLGHIPNGLYILEINDGINRTSHKIKVSH